MSDIKPAKTFTVDAELFDSLQGAIDFVEWLTDPDQDEQGIVYTPLADTLFAKSLNLPKNVRLETKRPGVAEDDGA